MSVYLGNRYKIVKLIGKGGMADVYLAYDTILNREVAIKILKADLSDDPVAVERFSREAGAVTKLSHPNIVDVYDVGDDGNKHYIVMEYVKGYTLKQLIKNRGPIPYKEAVWIIKQLSGALMEAHRRDIIHRDIKSQNVLVKDDGTIKLSDFGIAVASGSIQLTSKDSVLGSVHYLAPELSRGKNATMQSDIYSLGIVFYELLTGDVPFTADTPVQVALKHIRENIPSVRSFDPNIPQSVENIIIKATARNLNNRYKNIALMIKDLKDCLKSDHQNDPKVTFNDNQEVSSTNIHVSDTAKQVKQDKSIVSNIFLIAISLLSIIILFLVLFFSGLIGNRSKMVVVPDVTNMTVQEARDILAHSNLDVDDSRIVWTLSDNVEKDLIISTSPSADEKVESGSRIKLTVSNGIYSVLKNYVGQDYKTAQQELLDLNFKVRLQPEVSDLDPGKVIEQSLEPGFKFDSSQNNEIVLKYSQETEIILPNELRGMSISDAIAYFNNNDIDYELILKDQSEFSAEQLQDSNPNTVIYTSPELGSSYARSSKDTVYVYYYQ